MFYSRPSETKEMISLQYLLVLTLTSVTLCVVIETHGEDATTCSGSLVITNTDGVETKFDSPIDKVTNIKKSSKIYSVRVEGCGCFYIYSRPRGRGASELVTSGQKWSGEDFGFSRAKSLERIRCEKAEKNAMPVWGVVLTVLGLVVFVAIAAVIFIRIRKYQAVSQDPS